MVIIEKRETAACCGKTQIIWKLNIPIKKEYLPFLQEAGFMFRQTYLDAGMLYIEDNNLLVTGVFGLTDMRIRCKTTLCNNSKTLLEQVILDKF